MKLKLLALVTIMIILSGCAKDEFRGTTTITNDAFYIISEKLNGEISQDMDLNQGDGIILISKIEGGTFKVKITDAVGDVIYSGTIEEDVDFTVGISDSGKHKIVVTGNDAIGEMTFLIVAD